MFGARKLCWINNLLSLKFRSQMVSPIQNILMKTLEIICRVILAKTSQNMIVNLLLMVLIDLPIIKFTCKTSCQWLRLLCMTSDFFSPIDWNNLYCKTLIIVHFFVLKHKNQRLSYIHKKFEVFFSSNLFCGSTRFSAPTLKIIWAWEVDAPEITWYE